jgi:hypothetical protein
MNSIPLRGRTIRARGLPFGTGSPGMMIFKEVTFCLSSMANKPYF